MAEENRSGLSEALETGANAAHAIKGAIKTGKALSGVAKGAAAGGPYGAVAGAVWGSRKIIGKIIIAGIALLLIPVMFVVMLPSLIFGGIKDAFFSTATDNTPVLNSGQAITENLNDIYFSINTLLGEGQDDAVLRITSDQDSTFDFLSSLFLSFVFIKLVRYADKHCEGGKLPVPVHVLGEELTACGVIPDLSRKISVIRSRNISISCVFQNLAGLQNRYPYNQWQEILGNCDVQLFLGCTDELTAEFISSRSGITSVTVSSKAKQLGTWRISNYTPEFRETSGVGKRPLLTPDEVLRLPLDKALVIVRGKKILQVDKFDYSRHPDYPLLTSCKASAHIPEWRRLEEEKAKTPSGANEAVPKKTERKNTKPKPQAKEAAQKPDAPGGIIKTDKDAIMS